ncbi:odorant receptor 13a-like [Odontomachus brunneus]|uniref:odorant receptor 13a-like n=1 Tax=Odontomachus brunneus TaxID=486640 RepID=UPI0013F1A80A|nr:odorant receptor 13a-like [Odontomachus brunneus]
MCEVPHNNHYQNDIKNSLQLTRNILSLIGVWPNFDGKRSACEKIKKFLRISILNAILYFGLVPSTLYWIFEKRFFVRIRLIPLLIYGLMSLIKYYGLINQEDHIKHCVKFLEEDWKYIDNAGARNAMLKFTRIGKRLAAISAIFLYSSGLAFRTLIPLSRGKIVTPQNITIRPLPYPTYFFSFDDQCNLIYYTLVYALHTLAGVIIMSIATSIYGLIIAFVMHACGQLKILVNLLEVFVEKEQQDGLEVNKKLGVIVEHQIRIRSFLQLVERTLHFMIFIEILGGTIIICTVCYCILMEWESSNSIAITSYFITFSTAVVNTFLFCYTGEQLITQTEKVAITSCELEWYRLPDKKARGIVLVMIMSNMPMQITAGKIFVLSFKTFGDILKTAVTYFNMLRTVTN